MTDDDKKTIQQMIDQTLKGSFSQKRVGDTPTDALQLVPKKYADTKISGGIVSAKGDLLVGSAPSVLSRLPIGSNGQVLYVDSTQTLGVKWISPVLGFWGDGSDGAATLDGTTSVVWGSVVSSSVYSMTRNAYCTTLTLNTGVTLKPSNWIPYASSVFTISGSVLGDAAAGGDGGNANSGSGSTGGTGGSSGNAAPSIAAGYIPAAPAGQQGNSGGNGASGNNNAGGGGNGIGGTSVTHSFYSSVASSGGNGGTGGTTPLHPSAPVAGTGAGGGSETLYITRYATTFPANTLLDVNLDGTLAKYTGHAGGGSGGSGGGGNSDSASSSGGGGGGSGGSGATGNTIAIVGRNIVLNGLISSLGGNGGKGGNGGNSGGTGDAAGGGGGGGGAGGSGGTVYLVYSTFTNSGSIITTGGNGGARGTKGFGQSSGTAGADAFVGNNGPTGSIIQIQYTF